MEDNAQPADLLDRYTQAGTERKRARRACKSCHAQKARCSGTLPKCLRCSQRGYECEYNTTKRSVRRSPQRDILPLGLATPRSSVDVSENSIHGLPEAIASERSQAGEGLDLGCDKGLIKSYIDAYFEYVNSIPGNGFIHKAIFLRSWGCGTVNPALLKAVCGASARFVSRDAITRRRAQKWITEAETYVWQNLTKPSAANLQVLTVVLFNKASVNEFLKAQALMALAAKMAYILQLNHENEALPVATRECRRRLMWSLYYIDKILAGGFPEMIVCPPETMRIQLPASLRNFELEIAGPTGKLRPGPEDRDELANMGIKSFYMRLCDIRSRILLYTRRIIIQEQDAYDTQDELRGLEAELGNFAKSLPESMSWSERNLFLRAYSPQLTSYVMLHCMWHLLYCDLYRFAVPGIRDFVHPGGATRWPQARTRDGEYYAKECGKLSLEHAVQIIEILRLILKSGYQASVTDAFMSVIIYHSSTIIARSRALGLLDTESGKQILERLPDVMGIMDALSKTNPALEDTARDIGNIIKAAKDGPVAPVDAPAVNDSYRKTTIPFILLKIRSLDNESGPDIVQDQELASPSAARDNTTPQVAQAESEAQSSEGQQDEGWGIPDTWAQYDDTMAMSPVGAMFDPFWRMHTELEGSNVI